MEYSGIFCREILNTVSGSYRIMKKMMDFELMNHFRGQEESHLAILTA